MVIITDVQRRIVRNDVPVRFIYPQKSREQETIEEQAVLIDNMRRLLKIQHELITRRTQDDTEMERGSETVI